MSYKITIEEKTPYNVKSTRYEASDGKRYTSTYGIPADLEYKTVEIETGAIDYNSKTVFMQEIDEINLGEIIMAINKRK
jgi:hypothetical protein